MLALLISVSISSLSTPLTVRAYVTTPGITATDFARDFFAFNPFSGVGPVGVTFDSSGNLYVSDNPEGSVYVFGPQGGSTYDSGTLLASHVGFRPAGLAFTKDGHLYLARQGTGDVVEISPQTGQILRTVATGMTNATGLATDPLSGDLFVSQAGGGPTIWRLEGFANGPAAKVPYASVDVDGITFAPDGTIYGSLGQSIIKIPGTNVIPTGPWLGQTIFTDSSLAMDGIAVGLGSDPAHPPFLYVNSNNGFISRIDLTTVDPATGQPARTDIFKGGTRGDLVAVSPLGCLYATQSDSVVKLTDTAGACNPPLSPTGSGVPPASINMNLVNGTGDGYYDNAFVPDLFTTLNVVISGSLTSAALYVDGTPATVYSNSGAVTSVLPGGQFRWISNRNADGSLLYASHVLQVRGTDSSGNPVTSAPLTLYALVNGDGSAVSFLPDGAVAYNPFSTDPFDAGCLDGTTFPSLCVNQPPLTEPPLVAANFRMVNHITIQGKSDGTKFIETPRVFQQKDRGRSFICDSPAAQAALGGSFVSPPFVSGAYVGYESFLKTRVNLTLPNVFRVSTPPGVTGPTDASPFVPYIYTSIDVEIAPNGQSLVNWDPSGNSLFPYHYLYNFGRLVGGRPTPTPDQASWIRTATQPLADAADALLNQTLPLPVQHIARKTLATSNLDIWMSEHLFAAERGECARGRFAALNQVLPNGQLLEDYLQQNFPKLPVWVIFADFLNENILPHYNSWEFGQGVAKAGFTRDPRCLVAGCPGLEHAKVIGAFSPIALHVYDPAGHHAGPLPDGSIEQGIPSVTYLTLGHITYAIVPNDPGYRVSLLGTGSGIATIDVMDFNGSAKLGFQQYDNIDVTSQSRASLSLGSVGTTLAYDVGGSGTPITLAPSTSVVTAAPDSSDVTPPTTAASVSGSQGQPGYYRSPVDVHLTGSDDLTGVAETDYSLDSGTTWSEYQAPIHLQADGAYQLSYRSTDYMGNQEQPKSLVVVIDTGAPAISVGAPTASVYALRQVVLTQYSCSDSGSGLATCSGPAASGAQLDTSSVGVKTFIVSATDKAGNQATQSVVYSVDYVVCALYDQTKAVQSGSTVPIKIELCDSSGANVSDPSITVTATGLTKISTSAAGALMAAGNANPDDNFRFDATLATGGGYIYNLKTTGLDTGTYSLSFTAANDPVPHSVQFEVR